MSLLTESIQSLTTEWCSCLLDASAIQTFTSGKNGRSTKEVVNFSAGHRPQCPRTLRLHKRQLNTPLAVGGSQLRRYRTLDNLQNDCLHAGSFKRRAALQSCKNRVRQIDGSPHAISFPCLKDRTEALARARDLERDRLSQTAKCLSATSFNFGTAVALSSRENPGYENPSGKTGKEKSNR